MGIYCLVGFLLLQPAYGEYAEIRGVKMYYELHGKVRPVAVLHGGMNSIQTVSGVGLGATAEILKELGPPKGFPKLAAGMFQRVSKTTSASPRTGRITGPSTRRKAA